MTSIHYLSLTILTYFWTIFLTLVTVFSLGQLFVLLAQLNIGIGWYLTVKLWLLSLPFYLGILAPFSIFLATLVGFSKLKQSYEYIAIILTGVSKWQVLMAVVKIALLLSGLCLGLVFFIQPEATQVYKGLLRDLTKTNVLNKVQPTKFSSLQANGDKIVLYAKDKNVKTGGLSNAFVAIKREDKTGIHWHILHAKSLDIKHDKGDYLLLSDGVSISEDGLHDKLEVMNYDKYGINLLPKMWFNDQADDKSADYNKVSCGSWSSCANLSFVNLIKAVSDNSRALAYMQFQLSLPISILVFTLLAYFLSDYHPRVSRMPKYFIGLVYYSAYTVLLFVEQHMVKNQLLDPWLCFFGLFAFFAILCMPVLYWHFRNG